MSSPERAEPEQPTDTQAAEAELYAASAAENALPSDKSLPTDTTDLSALSEALDTAAVSEDDGKEKEEPTTDEQDTVPARTDEPQLTKEEMVEEALNCPCIAAMKDGPCGDSFIAAYRCFLESETEPKGMDCMEQFTGMQGCMSEHPEAYATDDDDDPFAAPDKSTSEAAADQTNSEDKPTTADTPPSPSPAAQVSS